MAQTADYSCIPVNTNYQEVYGFMDTTTNVFYAF